MKWLFIIAALLNLAFFVYNTFLKEPVITQDTVAKVADKNRIILLSELDSSELRELQNNVISKKITQPQTSQDQPFAESTETVPVQASEHFDAKETLCFILGPFSKEELNDIRLKLEKEYKNTLSFRIETTSKTTYYRIYIPPVESKEVRNKTLALLNKHGLEDNYVMSIDGRKNAIALGVFKKRSAAETIAAKASKIGLATTIEAISDDKDSLYKLQLVFQKNLDMKAYEQLLEENKIETPECEK